MRVRRLPYLLVLAACLAGGARAGPPQAGEKAGPADRKDVDRQVHAGLRDAINQGADLYNAGEPAGCYYLFHGALVTAGPLLSHRPEVQKIIQEGLSGARRLPRFNQRAHALRGVLNRVRNIIDSATLWERLGGEVNVRKVVDDFVAAAATDPKVDFFRGGTVKDVNVDRLKKTLLEQISDVSGGPYRYSGRNMREVHRGMGITDAQFDALAGQLRRALEWNGAKPDDVAAVMKVIGTTRGDIVEIKKEEKKPPEQKDPGK